jgi:hypothetical protein
MLEVLIDPMGNGAAEAGDRFKLTDVLWSDAMRKKRRRPHAHEFDE